MRAYSELEQQLIHRMIELDEKVGSLNVLDNIIDSFYAPSAIDLSSVSTSISFASRMLKIPRILLSKISTDLAAKSLGGYSLFILTK